MPTTAGTTAVVALQAFGLLARGSLQPWRHQGQLKLEAITVMRMEQITPAGLHGSRVAPTCSGPGLVLSGGALPRSRGGAAARMCARTSAHVRSTVSRVSV